jgi:hypothetical protein
MGSNLWTQNKTAQMTLGNIKKGGKGWQEIKRKLMEGVKEGVQALNTLTINKQK